MGIGVLGTTVVDGDATLSRRERRLLAALVLDAPHLVVVDRLADAVWGDELPASWAKVLQSCIWQLRRRLGREAIAAGPSSYRLDLAADEIDAVRFERLVDRAERELALDPLKADALLDDAERLWRGTPYLDLEHWPAAVGASHRLEARRRAAAELRAEASLGAGRIDDAIAAGRALVDDDGSDERRATLLATALHRAGRSVEALQVLQGLRHVLRSDFGVEPGPAVTALELGVLQHDVSLSAGATVAPPGDGSTRGGHLPFALSRLVGRLDEIEHVRRRLTDERLVVLTGSGGVGKTRLALAVAHEANHAFTGGTWFVALADLRHGDAVDTAVAGTFGFLPLSGRTPRASVLEGIRDRDVLLVMDNCEHVIGAASNLVAEALSTCPRLRVLATSREVLGVTGECIITVLPLAVETESVQLFTDRARSFGVPIGAGDREQLVEICRRLDGIPLAIELAAARLRTVPLAELHGRLTERLDVLSAAGPGRDDRHRTMRATMQWSFDLLEEDERTAFRRASVFSGAFDLAAAEAVLAGPPLASEVLDVLAALVDKSMVLADPQALTPFRLLEPVRQFAAAQLESSGESEERRRIHAEHYARAVDELEALTWGPGEPAAASRLDAARSNVRSAFSWAVAAGAVDVAMRIVANLSNYALLHVWTEPWSWCDQVLRMAGADVHPLRAEVLAMASDGAWQLDDHTRAIALADEAIALAEPGGATWRHAQSARADALAFEGRMQEAVTAATASVVPLSVDASPPNLAHTGTLLLIRALTGDLDGALARDVVAYAELAGCPSTLAYSLHTASIVDRADDIELAIARNERAVALARTAGAVLIEGFALSVLARVEAMRDPVAGAARAVDVLARYLAVGNGAHLRGFARAMIPSLAACREFEATALVDGATETDTSISLSYADEIGDALVRARLHLGPDFELARARGVAIDDDELVAVLKSVVSGLETAPPG
jgi:predicted ATPase/DNA-binding SARP family transcriptional activator